MLSASLNKTFLSLSLHFRNAFVCPTDGSEEVLQRWQDERSRVHGGWQPQTQTVMGEGRPAPGGDPPPLLLGRQPAADHRRDPALRLRPLHVRDVQHAGHPEGDHRTEGGPGRGGSARLERGGVRAGRRVDDHGDHHHRGGVLRRGHLPRVGDHHLPDPQAPRDVQLHPHRRDHPPL